MIADVLSDAVSSIRDHYLKDPVFAEFYTGDCRREIEAVVGQMDALCDKLDRHSVECLEPAYRADWTDGNVQ